MNKVEPPTKRQLAEALSEWNENGAIERTLHNCGEAHIVSGELPQICVDALTGDLIIAASREQGVLPLGWPIVNAEAEWLEEDCLARGLNVPDFDDSDEVTDASRDLHESLKEELRAAIAATPVDKLEDIDALTEIFRRLEDECSQQLEMWHYERAG